jgi:tetratricopeptide (TPR) repeat protein
MLRAVAVSILLVLSLWPGTLPWGGTGSGGYAFAVGSPDEIVSADFNDKIMVVRGLLRQNNYDGASALLEELYQRNPANELVYNLLRECYTRLSFWPKLEALTVRFARQYPYRYYYQQYLGEALAKMGRKDESVAAYKAALGIIQREDTTGVNIVFDRMMADGFDEAIIGAIDSIRTVSSAPTAFALQRGKVLENRKQYVPAAMEFFALLGTENTLAVQAERRLHALLGFEESSNQVEKALLAQTETAANVRAFKVLSSFYLSKDDFRTASSFVIKQDSAEGYQGNSLVNFMRSCAERRLYSEAVSTGEYIIGRYAGKPFICDVYLTYAQALTGLGRTSEAIAAYDTVAAKFPGTPAQCEAIYGIGSIYLDELNDCNRALVYFDSVTRTCRKGVIYLSALLAVPHTYLRMGDLKEANSRFTELTHRQLAADMMEDVCYHLALVKFLDKQFDSAKVGFQKLMVDYPRGLFVNDALELLILQDRAGDARNLLVDYSEALLFEIRRLPDSAVVRLRRLADAADKTLSDVALSELTTISLDRSDTTAALACIDRLAVEFPESYYLPYALKTKADICFARPDSMTQALEIYQRLLEKYPDFPFVSEVRKKMRQAEAI